jgi:hypothetical protein
MSPSGKGGELPRQLDDGLFDFMGYLLTSARGLLDEPASYGPFRLLEGASRLCGLMSAGASRRGSFLDHLKLLIDDGKLALMSDPEAFKGLLDEAVREYVRAMKTDGEAGRA